MFVAANIADEENAYNRKMAKEQNIPDDKFSVEYASFDDLKFQSESFDVIFSNEAILHSSDKPKLMKEISRILTTDGIVVISDIIEAPNVEKAKLTEVY